MDPIIGGALISGGASLLGGAMSSISSAADSRRSIAFTRGENELARRFAQRTTDQNFEENARNRKFQELMSSSAYQRATADMKAAGINPMVAFMKGGADSAGGSSGGAQTASTSSQADIKETRLGEGLMRGAGSALDAVRLGNETNLAQAAVAAKKAETILNATSAKGVDIENARKKAELPAQVQHGKIDADVSKWDALIDRLRSLIPFTESRKGR